MNEVSAGQEPAVGIDLGLCRTVLDPFVALV
jgi:hypothetical protein